MFSRKYAVFGVFVILTVLALPAALFAGQRQVTDFTRSYQHEDWEKLSVEDVLKNREIRMRDALSRLPKMQAAAVERLYPGELHRAEKLVDRLDDSAINAREDEAVRTLGAAYRQEYSGSRIVLGDLSRMLQPLAKDNDEFIRFLADFLKGYTGNEVLILTKQGVSRLEAYSPGRPFHWREAPEEVSDTDMLDRIYSTEDVTMIPFFDEEHFEMDLWGKEGEPGTVWKVTPGHIIKRDLKGGDWQRVVLVWGESGK